MGLFVWDPLSSIPNPPGLIVNQFSKPVMTVVSAIGRHLPLSQANLAEELRGLMQGWVAEFPRVLLF